MKINKILCRDGNSINKFGRLMEFSDKYLLQLFAGCHGHTLGKVTHWENRVLAEKSEGTPEPALKCVDNRVEVNSFLVAANSFRK